MSIKFPVTPAGILFVRYDFIQCSMAVYTRDTIGKKKSLSDVLLSVVFWCVFVRSLCSLFDLHSLWFQLWRGCPTFPYSNRCSWLQDVGLCMSCPPPGPITCSWWARHIPMSMTEGSFPHSLPFYASDTASTLTASWSRWSLVTSVPLAVGFGIQIGLHPQHCTSPSWWPQCEMRTQKPIAGYPLRYCP